MPQKSFDASWTRELADLHGISGAEYDNSNLQNILMGIFRHERLKDLSKKVLIPSFQLDNQAPQAGQRHWKPKILPQFPRP